MFDYQPILTGSLVDMRPVTAADWEALYAIGSDPKVWELHPHADRYIEANFRAYFADGLASGGALVALCRATGAVAGWSRYSAEFAEPDEIEIGWTFLGRQYWGGSYNRDMKTIMLAHAFRFVPQVILRIGEHNLRSRRAAEKIGAKLIDRAPPAGAVASMAGGVVYYAIARGDFLGR
jgi:RimJ/RimL family protein N-acetyltransferase